MRDIINITMGELTTAVDNEVVKAVQKVGIDVDKEELLKALELYHNLVHCEECKKWRNGWCYKYGRAFWPFDFCSCGERRAQRSWKEAGDEL